VVEFSEALRFDLNRVSPAGSGKSRNEPSLSAPVSRTTNAFGLVNRHHFGVGDCAALRIYERAWIVPLWA